MSCILRGVWNHFGSVRRYCNIASSTEQTDMLLFFLVELQWRIEFFGLISMGIRILA